MKLNYVIIKLLNNIEVNMRIICNGTELSEAFNKVIKAISSKINIPILEGVKISAFGDELRLIATDSELTIENVIKAEIREEGEALVKGKFTADIINVMNNQTIEVNGDDNNMSFHYEDSIVNVKCLDINEYPPIIKIDSENDIKLIGKDIKDLVKKTVYSAASDEGNAVLKGVLFEINNNKLNMVALDGFRLAMANKMLDGEYQDKKIIIPSKALKEVVKLISDDDIVSIRTDNKRITFDNGNTVLTTMLIKGEFLQYENIINKEVNTTITVIKNQLKDVISRASIIAKNTKSKLLKMEIKENVLIVSAETELGNIKEQMAIKQDGNDVILGINCAYLQDCIDSIDDEYIKIYFKNSVEPVIIKNLDKEDYLCLILPIRLY